MPIVINKIGESGFFSLADLGVYEVSDGGSVFMKKLVAGGVVDGDAVSGAELLDSDPCDATGRYNGCEIACEPIGQAGVST